MNQQNFSSEDLLGVTSSGGGRQGGAGNRDGGAGGNRGGGRPGGNFGGVANNFLVGQANGLSSTNAFGINYGNMWGKKVEVTGSYFFNNSNTDNNQLSKTRYLQEDSSSIYDESDLSAVTNYNNRLNIRLEYKIDSSNSIIFSPSISFQNNKSGNNVAGVRFYDSASLVSNKLISQTRYNSSAKTSGYNSNNSLLFRHSFPKRAELCLYI